MLQLDGSNKQYIRRNCEKNLISLVLVLCGVGLVLTTVAMCSDGERSPSRPVVFEKYGMGTYGPSRFVEEDGTGTYRQGPSRSNAFWAPLSQRLVQGLLDVLLVGLR